MKIVIALGGNALGQTPTEQFNNAKLTAKYIVPIIKEGHEVVLTHGNGPQVGLINLAFSESSKINSKVSEMPFSECSAMSEGYIAYHLSLALTNELYKNGINKKVTSLITNVLVDEADPAFLNPTKPIGNFYTYDEIKDSPYPFKEDSGRGYRRVIASPKPVKILEENEVNTLLKEGYIVITCGGGGIPVIKDHNGYRGIDAVIDKDYASSKLASDINADKFLILTTVKNAKINFNKPNELELFKISSKELEMHLLNGEFKDGSMKPKVEACLNYLKSKKDGVAIITDIDNALNALNGLEGTIVEN